MQPTTVHTRMEVEIGSARTLIWLIEDDLDMGCEEVEIGGAHVDTAIASYLRASAFIEVGHRAPEALKLRLGGPDRAMAVKGRSVSTGEPSITDVALSDVHGAALEAMAPAMKLVAGCQEVWGVRDEDVDLEGAARCCRGCSRWCVGSQGRPCDDMDGGSLRREEEGADA